MVIIIDARGDVKMAVRKSFGKTWWGNAWVEAMERIDIIPIVFREGGGMPTTAV